MLKTLIKCNKKAKMARKKLLNEQKISNSSEVLSTGVLEIKKSC